MTKPPNLRPQSIQARITHLLNHWPSDPVRPASVSVQNYLRSRLPPSSELPPNNRQQRQSASQGGEISETSLDALSSLLENRYARQYPLPPKLRRPASNPDHYDNVIREFAEAPSRDWTGRLGKRLKGLFRFK
ncbi:hypothetical protein EYZ11_005496 [Aspergillus tanneri]|uniref:Uncharacterized protein n=1 Tax=Aspergillus tanneri TaxID=1220188 RepID=A0A4S3JIC9_9EURO|nr:uncharacterized protein ATNIH1004_002492 [Aspergillus tanneri]KAA8649815.1 hypothetical protein ATNIH1004_002492 [Aspergillus tanneri]THC95020.1 hypothetical protein EYZ11_005496 [Aspergillus tanneri]